MLIFLLSLSRLNAIDTKIELNSKIVTESTNFYNDVVKLYKIKMDDTEEKNNIIVFTFFLNHLSNVLSNDAFEKVKNTEFYKELIKSFALIDQKSSKYLKDKAAVMTAFHSFEFIKKKLIEISNGINDENKENIFFMSKNSNEEKIKKEASKDKLQNAELEEEFDQKCEVSTNPDLDLE